MSIHHEQSPSHVNMRKRKRRTKETRPEIHACLELISSTAVEVAQVSDDLADALDWRWNARNEAYVAVAHASTPNPSTAQRWIIIPCIRSRQTHSAFTLQLPSQSQHAAALLTVLHPITIDRTRGRHPAIQVRVTAVAAAPLDTIFISIDEAELAKHDHVQRKYAGGFLGKNKPRGDLIEVTRNTIRSEKGLQDLIRASLPASIALVREGDNLQLALPTHPVTHAAPPSAVVTACEPVAQGLVGSHTRIVVVTAGLSTTSTDRRKNAVKSVHVLSNGTTPQEIDEDTANEAFFTAAEDEGSASTSETANGQNGNTASEGEDDTEDDDLSDDPEDIITLTSPTLGAQSAGTLSALTSATPRPFLKPVSGLHTPGSVFSTITSATMRGGQARRSKVLQTRGLVARISDDLLHPRPLPHDDEEARVYVDTAILVRLGCFSGDWVELSASADPSLSGITTIGMASFVGAAADGSSLRCVKVYGLPEQLASRAAPRAFGQTRSRSDSISSTISTVGVPRLHASPILLVNLGNPEFIKISPMQGQSHSGRTSSKIPAARMPPVTKEVTLLKVQSPASTDKALDATVMNRLRAHFERKQRLVQAGDLVAISIEDTVGRATFDGDADISNIARELMDFVGSTSLAAHSGPRRSTDVVWFRISTVAASSRDDDEDSADPWQGLVTVIPSKTKIHQSGTETLRLPSASTSPWPYYQGLMSLPLNQSTRPRGLPYIIPTRITGLQRRLRELISTSTSPRAIHIGLPPSAILLHSTQRNIGKAYVTARVCRDLGIHCFPINSFEIMTEAASGRGDNTTVGLLESRVDRALQSGAQNTCLLIQHIEVFESARLHTSIKDRLSELRVLVATTTDLEKVPEDLRALFTHEIEMSAPDEAERETILQSIVADSAVALSATVDLAAAAMKTAALVAGDLAEVVDRAIAARSTRVESLARRLCTTDGAEVTSRDLEIAGGDSAERVTSADFAVAIDQARKNFSDAIGAPKIPNVQWSDVGGLANVKDAVMETIQLPLSRPELFAKGLKKRSGILFYGPPGTGKTLLAKAIATEFSLNFFSVKGPELLNMYIGESEANVRRVFQRARDARPCVVFFDELDSIAPKRGNQGDSGGVMDRIVSQLLAELDGMSDGDSEDDGAGAGVFVIGATNRPDLLDQALLRPGRFDKMLYLGISDTHDKQQKILEALTRKFIVDSDLRLSTIAEKLPFTYTGADLYALCSDAMLKAVTRSARAVDERVAAINEEQRALFPSRLGITVAQFFDHHARPSDLDVLVTEKDFLDAKAELVPSVSVEELRHYERVRKDFEGDRTTRRTEATHGVSRPGIMNEIVVQQPDARFATVDDIEAWQAKKIEELMHAGFADGSLARNNRKPEGDTKSSILIPYRGNGVSSQQHESQPQPQQRSGSGSTAMTGSADAEEDVIVRTAKLDINGNGNGNGSGGVQGHKEDKKGKERHGRSKRATMSSIFSGSSSKGKHKAREASRGGQDRHGSGTDGFGDAARDEGMYE